MKIAKAGQGSISATYTLRRKQALPKAYKAGQRAAGLCGLVKPAGTIIAEDVLEQLGEALLEEAAIVVPARCQCSAHEM